TAHVLHVGAHYVRALYAFSAYLRGGNALARFSSLASFLFACSFVNARRMARVFLMRRSRGKNFRPFFFAFSSLIVFRTAVRWLCLYTVSTRAMDLRTTLIFESLLGAPPVTLATRRALSSLFRSLS
ncbi:hypothetical protein Vretifemale_2247, partial [Volvox reticuliferus]